MKYGVNIDETNYIRCKDISHPEIEHSEVIGIVFDIRYNIINLKPNYITFDYVGDDLFKCSIKKFKSLDDVMFEVKDEVFELSEIYNSNNIELINNRPIFRNKKLTEEDIKEKINSSVNMLGYF